MNSLLNSMKNATNYGYTENHGVKHNSTQSKLLDLFAMGASMRKRTDADVVNMFKQAYDENPAYAMKCLFYIRDVRGGQGERRFFRVVMKWLASYDSETVRRNVQCFPEFGRYDDWYCLFGTKLENDVLAAIKHQLALDVRSKTPSLLAKWLPSENASSKETKARGNKVRTYLGMNHKEYRKVLAALRTRINIVEKLMSENRWDEIEFDKLPSKAGFIYKNAFAKRDIIKAKYEKFAQDDETKVNAGTLYPYKVVEKALKIPFYERNQLGSTDRLMVNKYWANLKDYFNGATLNALCVVDTSDSMSGTPINVATSLGLYCAERANGPFHNHYISFSSRPQLIETNGLDFCDKVYRIVNTNLCENTNIVAAFDLVLDTAVRNHVAQSAMPETILVISDMEFDEAASYRPWGWNRSEAFQSLSKRNVETVMETIAQKFQAAGYEMPKLVFWNVNARSQNVPMLGEGVSYVSGFSPSIFESIMTGKSGYDLMMEVLDKDRYSIIY